MKSNKILIFFLLITSAFPACVYQDKKRDNILFEDDFRSVQDSLVAINTLLKKLPKNGNLNVHYSYKNKQLQINIETIPDIDLVDPNSVTALNGMDGVSEKRRFLSLIKYLYVNHLNIAFFDHSLNTWVYSYRVLDKGEDSDDARDIIFKNTADLALLKKEFRILDERDGLCLIALKQMKK